MQYLLAILVLIPSLACANNFGDYVAKCLANKGVQPNTQGFQDALPYCEVWADGAKQLAEAQAASDALMKCLLEKASMLDDGISQAADVAKVISAACNAQAFAYEKKLDPDVKSLSTSRRTQLTEVPALTAVLSVRATKRNRQDAQRLVRPQQ
ncbi:MAG: hypothetical protein A2W72_18470 [Burkholderiales bacterium RIFCSPLOWO2_12_67_14]|nr:MAG: hypothetical protein A2W72_18470 [Burkholderiales bacterium RIFCSPLOWO2_12_67_14]